MKLFLGLAGFILLVIGLFQSFLHVNLAIFGKETIGQIESTYEQTGRNAGITVYFSFKASNGRKVNAKEKMWLGWEKPESREVVVIYNEKYNSFNKIKGSPIVTDLYFLILGALMIFGDATWLLLSNRGSSAIEG